MGDVINQREMHQTALNIAKKGLDYALSLVKPGAIVGDIVKSTDKFVFDELLEVYQPAENDIPIDKGMSLPTLVCVNNQCGFCSDINSKTEICEGNVVNIALGVQIQGLQGIFADYKLIGEPSDIQKSGVEILKNFGDLVEIVKNRAKQVLNSEKYSGPTQNEWVQSMSQIVKDLPKVTALPAVVPVSLYSPTTDGQPNMDNFEVKPTTKALQVTIHIRGGDNNKIANAITSSLYVRTQHSTKFQVTPNERSVLDIIDKQFPVYPFRLNDLIPYISHIPSHITYWAKLKRIGAINTLPEHSVNKTDTCMWKCETILLEENDESTN